MKKTVFMAAFLGLVPIFEVQGAEKSAADPEEKTSAASQAGGAEADLKDARHVLLQLMAGVQDKDEAKVTQAKLRALLGNEKQGAFLCKSIAKIIVDYLPTDVADVHYDVECPLVLRNNKEGRVSRGFLEFDLGLNSNGRFSVLYRYNERFVYIYDLASGDSRDLDLKSSRAISCVALDASGELCAVTHHQDNEIHFYRYEKDKWVFQKAASIRTQAIITSLIFCKGDSQLIVAGDNGSIEIWDVYTKERTSQGPGVSSWPKDDPIRYLSINANKNKLAGCTAKGRIIIWDIDKDELILDKKQDKIALLLSEQFVPRSSISWFPGGQYLICGDSSGNMSCLDTDMLQVKKVNMQSRGDVRCIYSPCLASIMVLRGRGTTAFKVESLSRVLCDYLLKQEGHKNLPAHLSDDAVDKVLFSYTKDQRKKLFSLDNGELIHAFLELPWQTQKTLLATAKESIQAFFEFAPHDRETLMRKLSLNEQERCFQLTSKKAMEEFLAEKVAHEKPEPQVIRGHDLSYMAIRWSQLKNNPYAYQEEEPMTQVQSHAIAVIPPVIAHEPQNSEQFPWLGCGDLSQMASRWKVEDRQESANVSPQALNQRSKADNENQYDLADLIGNDAPESEQCPAVQKQSWLRYLRPSWAVAGILAATGVATFYKYFWQYPA